MQRFLAPQAALLEAGGAPAAHAALWAGVQCKNADAVQAAIDAGADPLLPEGSAGRTALMAAAGSGVAAVVKAILKDATGTSAGRTDTEGATALEWGVWSGDSATVDALLARRDTFGGKEARAALTSAQILGYTNLVSKLQVRATAV